MNLRLISTSGKLIALCAAISFTSCKKDVTSNSNDSGAATLSDSSTVADNTYYDVLNTAMVGTSDNNAEWSSKQAKTGKTVVNGVDGETTHLGCAIYSFDSEPGEYPKTMTLDFGAGCTSADGIFRKGKLIYLFSNPLFFPGTSVSVTFENYVVNGYGIKGAYSITNNSNENIGIRFTTQVTNGIITYPNSYNYHYSHNKVYTLTAGLATAADISDDVYAITGNSSFSDSNGASIVFTTNTPLVKAINCHNISGGQVGFVYNENVRGTIDFGSGTCDNLATVSVGNITRTINLR